MNKGAKVTIWLSAEANAAWQELKRNTDYSLSANTCQMVIAQRARQISASGVIQPEARPQAEEDITDVERFLELY